MRLGDPIQLLWLPPMVGEGSGLTSSGGPNFPHLMLMDWPTPAVQEVTSSFWSLLPHCQALHQESLTVLCKAA